MVSKTAKLATVAAQQALDLVVDPAPAFKFFAFVEINGVLEARFTECTGLKMERDVETYYEGGNNTEAHQLPGRIKHSNITLSRGITFSRTLWDWFLGSKTSSKYHIVEKVPVSIILFSAYSVAPARWYDLVDAFPVSISGPDLKTSSGEVAIESIEIAYRDIQLNLPPNLGVLGGFV